MSSEIILVVDDSKELADFTAFTLLPELGYQARVVYTGRDALESIQRAPPALMLLDLELPDLTGLDLLRKLAEQNIQIPAILVTAHGSEKVAVDAFRLGVQDYLSKPADPETLSAAITRALTVTRLKKETARLTSELQEQVEWLNALSKISQSVTSTLDLSEVLRRIVDAAVELTQAEEGFLALLDPQTNQLYLRATKSAREKEIRTLRLPVTDSLVGEVLQSGKPVRVSQSSNGAKIKVSTGFLVQSLIHVPILSKGRPLGVLSVDNRAHPRPFLPKDEIVLTSLADHAAVAIENAHLYQQAQNEISERTRIELALRESEERYALAAQGANDGIWDWELRANQIYYSPRWKGMLGFLEEEIQNLPQEWLSRIHPDDLEKVKQALSAHVQGITTHFECEYRLRHKDGSYRWVLARGLAVRQVDGKATRIAGSQTDITIRKATEARLRYDAFHDRLTGLANRSQLVDRIKSVMERARQHPEYRFAILFLDMDQFKNVNDRFGHPFGDKLLIQIGNQLRALLRPNDLVARLGGDEFVILLDDIRHNQVATSTAERILASFRRAIEVDNHRLYTSTSIGVVIWAEEIQSPDDLLQAADIAMYAAKRAGKSCYKVFEPTMRRTILDRLGLEADLRLAIENQTLGLHFQPIVDLGTGHLTGFEALARWRHLQLGQIPPIDFISLAQESSLILELDRWVLRSACHLMNQWQSRFLFDPPLRVSVNITSSSMAQADLVETVEAALAETDFPARQLHLEITEDIAMESTEIVSENIAALRQLGIQLHIDDFGTGYSSLSYLQQLPVSALKIAQPFIQQSSAGASHTEIVRTIINLSHDLGLKAVAEGIESLEQLEMVRSMHCDFAQGYLLSHPLEVPAVEALLEQIQTVGNQATSWSAILSGPKEPDAEESDRQEKANPE